MAKRFTLQVLSELAKRIGGSHNKWTGTRTNINFLGKGPTRNPLFQSPISGLEGASEGALGSREALISAVNDAMGYASAGKLNSIQTEILGRNFMGIDKILHPPPLPSASITPIAPGIEGLKRFPKETHKFFGRPLKSEDFIEIERLAKEGKLGHQNPELYKGAQPGSTITKAIDESVKINPGLKFFEGHELPQKTYAARATMYRLLDMPATAEGTGLTLREIMSKQDLKWLLEGGGGTKGDPIAMFAKYFGNASTRNLPSETTPAVIDSFAKRLIQAKDTMGRRIDDPFFDPEDVPFAHGGLAHILQIPRTDFRLGGFGGKFSKAQVLVARLKNTLKNYAGKTDETSVYVNETFPNFIKEIEANPKLAENEHVWKALGGGLPKNQRLVVHGDDTVDFFRQTSGPGNIDRITAFLEKHPFLSREEAMRIMKMEPEDQILEITRLETIRRTPNASGGLARILEV